MAKIMLVEDDNNLRQIYQDRLAAEGYEITAAKDGEEALALAVKQRPDLIIADIMMPKVSGFDMLDILRSTPETKDAKIIMMTALSQAEDKTRAEKLGADKYLVKSQVTLEDVVEIANQMLNEATAGASLASTGAVTTEPTVVASAPTTTPIAVTAPPAEPVPTASTAPPTPTQPPADLVSSTAPPTPTSIPVTAPSDDTTTTSTSPTADTVSTSPPPVAEDAMKDKIDEFIASNPTLSASATIPAATDTATSTPEVPSAPEPETPKSISITTPEAEEPVAAPAPAVSTPTPPPASAATNSDQSDQAMAAMDGLLNDNKEGDNPSGAGTDTTSPAVNQYIAAAPKADGPESQSMVHTKRLEPLPDSGNQTTNINDLLAQESNHEAPTPPPINSVITPGGGSISPLPGSTVQDAISGTATPADTKPEDVAL